LFWYWSGVSKNVALIAGAKVALLFAYTSFFMPYFAFIM